MKHFGIHHHKKYTRRDYLRFLHVPFLVVILLCFAFFSFYANVTHIVFSKDKIDVVREDLKDIAFYFWTIDRDLSNFFITLDDIVQSYVAGENVLESKTQEIESTREYIKNNKDYLKGLGFDHYDDLIDFLADVYKHKDEVFQLLGRDQPYNYLVILQNSNEKRPNGGFFGSFAFVRISEGFIEDMEIIDAYYPNFIAPRSFVSAPSWADAFLDDRKIGFIAANKFGFTDIDGMNIKQLYEQIFNRDYSLSKVQETWQEGVYQKLLHQDIKGVIFIQSKLIEELLPTFREKTWERQFLNAAVDLIRGEDRGNKKELYIQEINQYFAEHRRDIAHRLINAFSAVLDQHYVDIYLSNVSNPLQGLIQKRQLSNVFSPTTIYAWDTNNSFNKVDSFVTKHIQITNLATNELVIETENDIIPIDDLEPGDYRMMISYTMNVPNMYREFIANLEEKYEIELGERELGILALQPNQYEPNTPRRWRQSKATIYLPPNATVTKVTGQVEERKKFQAPFANGLYYFMKILDNNTSKSMEVTFSLQ